MGTFIILLPPTILRLFIFTKFNLIIKHLVVEELNTSTRSFCPETLVQINDYLKWVDYNNTLVGL